MVTRHRLVVRPYRQLAQGSAEGFFQGINQGFLAAAVVAVLGIVSSAMKEK